MSNPGSTVTVHPSRQILMQSPVVQTVADDEPGAFIVVISTLAHTTGLPPLAGIRLVVPLCSLADSLFAA
ncbi:MAG: hypothetical protein FWH42_06340, partial [Dehalococcoidia bacterium]|nr:hypothetical protein [Dehalococcoidia bacterium]